MKQLTFLAVCNKLTINPGLALENEEVKNFLENDLKNDFNKLESILNEQF